MIKEAGEYFRENISKHVEASSDLASYNLNLGLLKLTEELHREVRKLHEEIGQVKQQVIRIQPKDL